MPKAKPNINTVTREFLQAHKDKADAEARMGKNRKKFFDLIQIPEDELARQTVYVETDDPTAWVAVMYPKWRIVSQRLMEEGSVFPEWRLLIEEDPEKKTYSYVNREIEKVFTRTVVEGAPGVDLAKLEEEDPELYERVTFLPEPVRELSPLDKIDDEDKEKLKKYLTPVKITNRMESPRDPKPEELEGSK